jgi:hypothetical protein
MRISEKDARRLGLLPAAQTSARSAVPRAGAGIPRRPSPLAYAIRGATCPPPPIVRIQERCTVTAIGVPAGSPAQMVVDDYVFHIQRDLPSANRLHNAHWSTKHRARKQWQAHLCNALVAAEGMAYAQRHLIATSGLYGAKGLESNRTQARATTVRILRLVPSDQHFIRDDDNLVFAAKQLVDALVQCGLIVDDARDWCERPIPTQAVSPDGTHWTIVQVTPR